MGVARKVVPYKLGTLDEAVEGGCDAVDGAGSIHRASACDDPRAECVAWLIVAACDALHATRQAESVSRGVGDRADDRAGLFRAW